jgi:hypothetical protein
MIDLQELARHRRMARLHAWRMKNDRGYWDAEVKRSMAAKVRADAIAARTAADQARGVVVGGAVAIGNHPVVVSAEVTTNLQGMRGTVVAISELPMGGLLAVVEVQPQVEALAPLTAADLRWARLRNGGQPLGRIRRSQPRTRYTLPVGKLQPL